MEDKKQGRDAADEAPRPNRPDKGSTAKTENKGTERDDRTDGGRAIPAKDLNSANDE